MRLIDVVKSVTAVFALISVVFGAFFFIDNRYAEQIQLFALEKRVSLNELRRQLMQAEEEAAYYRQLNRKYPDDELILEKLNRAEKRVRELEKQIEKLQ